MQVKHTQKFIRMSPRKLRLVADVIRELQPSEAMDKLPFLEKRAAEPIRKALKTALSNAKVLGFSPDQVEFEELQINEGPRLKRGRPVARGVWHPYQRKMSHIRIVLKTKKSAKPTKKKTKKDKIKKVKTPDKVKEQIQKGKDKDKSLDDKAKKAKTTTVKKAKDRNIKRTTNK